MKFSRQQWLFWSCLVLSGFALAVILNMLTSHTGGSPVKVTGMFTALQPIFLGIIMTYLLSPFASNCEQLLYKKSKDRRLSRMISVLSSAIIIIGLFVLFGYLILPQLVSSISTLSANLDLNDILNDFTDKFSTFLQNLGLPAEAITEQWIKAGANFMTWIEEEFMSTLLSITSGLYSVAKVAVNLVIGIIVMIYLLYSRDQFIGQSKKVLYAVCSDRKICSVILKTLRQINLIFAGYLAGKVIDSLIIGVFCFIGLTILAIPYPLLISVIIGVTNIIPVFGPFIGAVPSALLLLITDPAKCVVFLIFIIILQQIDGNIIGPMILGDSTGLSAFWVLFSLLLFQHFLGFWGLVIGVPLFATIYYLFKQFVNYLLKKRGLPLSSSEYVDISEIREDGTSIFLEKDVKKSFFPKKKKANTNEKKK